MPTVRFYASFSKRRNSTKRPSNSSSDTVVTCTFKEDTSIKNPVLIFKGQKFDANYCYIADTLSYYYVEDIISRTKYETEYHLKLDSMATHKTGIGNTVARIAFSSTGYNKYLVDSRMGVDASVHVYNQVAASGITGGKNVLSVANTLGISYYGMTDTMIERLMEYLMDDSFAQQIVNIFNQPMNAILGCVWVPYFPDNINLITVRIGDELLSGGYGHQEVKGEWISSYGRIVSIPTVSILIPYRWQDFRDMSPYTEMSLYLPGIGNVDLNANDFINSTNVNIITTIDITTGDIIYRIFNDDMELLQTISFAGGVPVPISGTQTNVKGALASIGGIAAGVVTAIATEGMAVPVAAGMIMSGASAVLNAGAKSRSIKGSNGSRVDFEDDNFILTVTVRDTEDIDDVNYIAKKGRPVCLTQTISNHSGFVMCDEASVALKASSAEIEEVNSYLNSGFYYE